jgi:hypothetical protein
VGSGSSINEKRTKLDQKTSVLVKVASSVLNAGEGLAAARINFINKQIDNKREVTWRAGVIK